LVEHGEQLLLSRGKHDEGSFLVELVKKKDYLGAPLVREQFVPVPTPNWILIMVVLIMMTLVLLAWFLWSYKGREKGEEPEPIQVKEVETLTELEKQMMVYFFELGEMGFESSDLNRFFDHGDPNFDTLKKRKDIKMRELKRKLSSITGIAAEEVFLEKRLESDRRIKMLYLNPEIKRENEGISL
jgi:hypothetical protein